MRVRLHGILFLMLLLSATAAAQSQDFTYTTNNGTITIWGYTGAGGDVIIPATINSFPVTRIGARAFYMSRIIRSVTIPDTVRDVGDGAFTISSLSNITIPNGVVSIGSGAFSICLFTNVIIPDSVISIGDSAFYGCPNLSEIRISANATNIGNYVFQTCNNLTSVTIPDSVLTIGQQAFDSCFNLTNVTLSSSSRLITIGSDSFRYCGGLASIVIPESVNSIDGGAFAYCAKLASITIPDSVSTIGEAAFSPCFSLTNVIIGKGVNYMGPAAFDNCTSLAGVYFRGNAPLADDHIKYEYVFSEDTNVVYYLPGTTGWGTTLGGAPTALWQLPNPIILNIGPNLGIQSNNFGFTTSWATNTSIVVEASTSLAETSWYPVMTNTLSNGSLYFTDPQWTNFPSRFYRIRSH